MSEPGSSNERAELERLKDEYERLLADVDRLYDMATAQLSETEDKLEALDEAEGDPEHGQRPPVLRLLRGGLYITSPAVLWAGIRSRPEVTGGAAVLTAAVITTGVVVGPPQIDNQNHPPSVPAPTQTSSPSPVEPLPSPEGTAPKSSPSTMTDEQEGDGNDGRDAMTVPAEGAEPDQPANGPRPTTEPMPSEEPKTPGNGGNESPSPDPKPKDGPCLLDLNALDIVNARILCGP